MTAPKTETTEKPAIEMLTQEVMRNRFIAWKSANEKYQEVLKVDASTLPSTVQDLVKDATTFNYDKQNRHRNEILRGVRKLLKASSIVAPEVFTKLTEYMIENFPATEHATRELFSVLADDEAE